MKTIGVDFTSAPKRDKKITVAVGSFAKELCIENFLTFSDWPAYEQWLEADDAWVGGFDFPFGLPKRFVLNQGWPTDWAGMVEACVRSGKEDFVEKAMKAFMASKKSADIHRATDLRTQSHSPLKTKANPPVGRMFYEGTWRLLSARINIPRLHETSSSKTAVEAYPGYLASRMGFRHYKNDNERNAAKCEGARKSILRLLREGGTPLGIKAELPRKLEMLVCGDKTGDLLDSVLCAVQAAWSSKVKDFGIPENVETCEGWIVTATAS
jgi:hypothetical protein